MTGWLNIIYIALGLHVNQRVFMDQLEWIHPNKTGLEDLGGNNASSGLQMVLILLDSLDDRIRSKEGYLAWLKTKLCNCRIPGMNTGQDNQ